MRRWLFLCALALSLFVFCDSRKDKLEAGVLFAKTELLRVGNNPIAAASFGSIAEGGGTPVTYITACLPEKDPVFDSYEDNKPTHPWTVVIREGAGARDF